MEKIASDPLLYRACVLLGHATDYRYRIDCLSGPAAAGVRQEIMSALEGRRVPKSMAGVNVLRRNLYARARIAGNCRADDDALFSAACRSEIDGSLTGGGSILSLIGGAA